MRLIIFISALLLSGSIGVALLISFALGLAPGSIFAIAMTVVFILMILGALSGAIVGLTRHRRHD